ncbi:protein of unknown function [Pustulibacterium marinum]|uniref:DUF4350 domain-containing protein n=1 Tax=Pustulibacterium marinum TaxID=1224947 RepID=A0A1I7H3Y5_9FLAO|nr:DUF4350 domain-containing protein [Pustulibacterium marinum]SFU55373.1 protein of unknown function [Pustulibacterium marinum]
MDKGAKLGLYIIGLVIMVLIVVEIAKPKPVNWKDSYTSFDKIPLGCYVLREELNEFPNQVQDVDVNITNNPYLQDSTKRQSLIMINNYFYFDETETNALLDFVARGNDVFISGMNISGYLNDTLKIDIQRAYGNTMATNILNTLSNRQIAKDSVHFTTVVENSMISSIDTLQTVALGYTQDLTKDDEEVELNFVKIPFGNQKGAFYLHTNPYAFSNYHILNGNKAYASSALSYILDNDIIWDNYYKAGRRVVTTPLRYVLQQDALKWAIYTAIISLIIFIIFRGKRTQRIIPVIQPLENTSLEFTKTIGSLYFQHKDYTNIIQKKIIYFLEYIRTNFYLNTLELNKKFVENLAVKSGKSLEETKDIIHYIQYLNNKAIHTEQDLVDLNTKIERFLNS